MPKEITTTVYEYSELSPKAQAKARDWYLAGADLANDCFDDQVIDAEHIGLKITRLVQNENEGEFIVSAIECSEKIFTEHGKECETYKAAQKFDAAIDALPELPEYGAANYHEIERELCESNDAAENDFLVALLECYRVMHTQNIEYYESDETVKESIEAAEYTFLEDGKMFG